MTETPHSPPARPPATDAANPPRPAPGRPIKPLVSIKAHRRVALGLFVAVVVLGLPVAWLKGQAVYYTEGALYVSPRFMKNLKDDLELEFQSNQQYRQFVEQQVKTVTRYDIVTGVAAALDSTLRPWPATFDPRKAGQWLQANLQVRPIADTYLITVGLEATRPQGMAETINAVLQAYLRQQRTESVYARDQRLAKLEEERARLATELASRSEDQTRLAQQLGVTSFGGNLPNPYDQLLSSTRQSLYQARMARIQAEASLAAVDGAARGDSGLAARTEADLRVQADGGLSSLKANLNGVRAQLMTKRSALGDNHPGRRAIDRELGDLDEELARVVNQLNDRYRGQLLQSRRTALFEARRAEDGIAAVVDSLAAQASAFAALYQQAHALDGQIERLRGQIVSVDERMDFLTIESDAPGFVRLEALARPPDVPVRGNRKQMLLMVVAAACFLALVTPVVIDILDPRLWTPGELERAVGFPPMGWLLERADHQLVAFGQEQRRRLAAVFERDLRRHGSRLVLLTSVKPGGGATSVALDLGHELGEMGLRAVVVEANPRRPDPRYGPVDGARSGGLQVILRGGGDLVQSVVPAGGDLPARVPVGTAPGTGRCCTPSG